MPVAATQDTLDQGPRATRAATRLCAATGKACPVEDMIRFVVSPEGYATPDLKRRLPGRGVWVTATRAALERAIARKAFARSFKRDVRVAADLADTTERLLERAALDALAIAFKAGRAVPGFAKVEAAMNRGEAVALLHAADAAPDGVRKLDAALRRQDEGPAIPVLRAFTSAQLDLALGRPNVIHAALLAGPESKAFLRRAARLERFRTGAVAQDRTCSDSEARVIVPMKRATERPRKESRR
ncbi:MAG: RNA-binding protein [Hyphomicrobiales bacterium]|nr:RNA-binding protein [Hyphomicrobiales bacterium]